MQTVTREKDSVNQARKQLARLYQIFGRVVFLVLPRGEKALKDEGWEKITFEETQKPHIRRSLFGALMRRGQSCCSPRSPLRWTARYRRGSQGPH